MKSRTMRFRGNVRQRALPRTLEASALPAAGEHLDDAGKIGLQEKVIEASLKAAADAQGHLLSMQMPRSKGRGSRSVPHRANPQPEPAPLQSPGSQAARGTATAAA